MKLQKSETVKRQHISMLKKTYESKLDEKRALIANLEDIVTQQEERINELESGTRGEPLLLVSPAKRTIGTL